MTVLQELFVQAGFPAFPLDEHGFPQLGPLVKYFRKKMRYTDLDGCERWWTQQDLANALGLKEEMVGLMETKNAGDSVSRRRALADILNIPPVFLGIGTLADLEAFLKIYHIGQPQVSSSTGQINENEVSLFKDALAIHWGMYYAGTLQDIRTLQYWANRISLAANEHSASQQSLEELVCGYDQLLAGVYILYKRQYTEALKHLDSAQETASALGNKSLEAAVCCRSVDCRLDQRKFALAKAPADRAVDLVRYADRSLQGQIYQVAALTYALTAQDEADRKKAWKFIDLAGTLATEDNLGIDVHHVRFNAGDYASVRADMLITLGQPTKALDLLDKADEQLPADQKQRRGYIQILQGEAYIRKKAFDTATTYLQNAFDTSSVIHSDYNIGYIDRLCRQLSNSSYRNSPAVATLKRLLREYQEKQAKEKQPSSV